MERHLNANISDALNAIFADGCDQIFFREWNAIYGCAIDGWEDWEDSLEKLHTDGKYSHLVILQHQNSRLSRAPLGVPLSLDALRILYSQSIDRSVDFAAFKNLKDIGDLLSNYITFGLVTRLTQLGFQSLVEKISRAFTDFHLDTTELKELLSQAFPRFTDKHTTLQWIKFELQKDKTEINKTVLQTIAVFPPEPSHYTVYREEEMIGILIRSFRREHEETSLVVLSGKSGCGKTVLARKFSLEYFSMNSVEEPKCVITINASTMDALGRSLAHFAKRQGIDEIVISMILESQYLSEEDKVKQLTSLNFDLLDRYKSWLIIADDVQNIQSFCSYLPYEDEKIRGHGQILITTTDTSQPFPLNIHYFDVGSGMSEADAMQLISQGTFWKNVSYDSALAAAKMLDFQPLGLACAVLYMNIIRATNAQFSWHQYLEKLTETSKNTEESNLYMVVKLVLRLDLEKQEVMHAFQHMSTSCSHTVPLKDVIAYVKMQLPEISESTLMSAYSSSLMLVNKDFQELSVHPVVYECLQTILPPDSSVPDEILARGSHAVEAYRGALQHGKVSIKRGRIMIIGQDRAGKTCLRKSLCGLPFDPEQPSTVGVDAALFGLDVDHVTTTFQPAKDDVDLLDKETLPKLMAKDLKFFQRQSNRPERDPPGQQLMSIVVDEEGMEEVSVENPDEVMQEVNADMPPDEPTAMEEIQTIPPFDLPESKDESNLLQDIISEVKVPDDVVKSLIELLQSENLEETIPEKETTISIWDFAGQHLYYASHQVFLSNRAIYLLVYNLAKDLEARAEPCVRQGTVDTILDNPNNETNLDSVLSWLVSVHTLCPREADGEHTKLPYKRPPVFIVGTHADEPFEDPKEMEKKLKIGILGKSYHKHVIKPCFTVKNVDSSDDEGIKKLHQKIMEVFDMEPYMDKEEPLRWLHFEKALKSIVEDKKTFFLSLEEIKEIAKDVCLIKDPNELNAMLDFYHDLGIIIKYGNTVVLQTQWLIDVFKKLITIRDFDNMDQRYTYHWLEMEESGKLHMELVDYIFKEELHCGQIKEDILKMMEHFGLIASFTQAGNESYYFVPSHLKSSPSEVFQQTSASDDPCPLYVHFPDGFIPNGLYTRLVCKLISWCKDFEPTLYRDASEYVLDMSSQTALVVVCYTSSIKLLLQSNSKERSYLHTKANEVRKFVEETLSGLRDQCPWYRCLRYEICVSCPSCVKKPCSRHLPICNEEKCLHLLPTIKDQPFWCKKSCGKDRWPIVSGYNYWCPKMPCASETADESSSCTVVVPTAGTLHLDDNVKRWVVVGISLNTVLIPPLRDYLEPYMERHYEHFKTNNNIDTQIHPGKLTKDGTAILYYGSINNNEAVKKAANYDYKVTSHVDLGKLYLKPFMAKFTAYDDSCDASAVLGILGSASVFSSITVQSKKVKDDVRNKWGHCNIEEWDETKFDECFTIMVELVQSLTLPLDDKQQLTDKLEEWKNQGLELLTQGNTEDEMKLLMEKVGDLSKNLSSLVDDEGKQDIVDKLLKNVKTAIDESMREIKQDVELLKDRVSRLESSFK